MNSEPHQLHPPLKEWVAEHLAVDCREITRLTTTESKNDPPREPFRSLYAARKLLSASITKLESCPEELKEHEDFKILYSCIQLELGLNYINSEELNHGETTLESCLLLLDNLPSKVKTASVSTQALNQLGILWGNRDEQQKALECLLKAKAIYESHISLPPPITDSQWLVGEDVSKEDRERVFESNHTLTLFYLAQVYGNLKQPKLSAQYCQTTLSRQLESGEYDAIEWSLNCATLSQYYFSSENYAQSRHCLAAASRVLQQFKESECGFSASAATGEEVPLDSRMAETLKRSEADISRCWMKYCLSLLTTSKENLENAESRPERQRHKLYKFEDLDLTGIEDNVTSTLIEDYEAAKSVFLVCQKHIKISKEFYTLEEYASEHVMIVHDHSNLYKLLAHFESTSELKCRMHKRRVDMLTALQAELNPQYYLDEHRQIMIEVAETLTEMAGLKIVAASDSPTVHAVAKINKLVWNAIHTFELFVKSYYHSGTGALPDSIDVDYLRPILCAKLNVARLYSKLIAPDPQTQVREVGNTAVGEDKRSWLGYYGVGLECM